MEEKKTDKNSIIGFVLIGLILIWVLYNNRPTPEEIAAKKVGQELLEQQPTTSSKENDSISIVDESNTLQDIGMIKTPSDSILSKTVHIENDIANYEIQTKGGFLSSIELKEFRTYNDKELFITKNNNHYIDISFTTADNKIIHTKNLIFQPKVVEKDGKKEVTLTAYISENQFLKYIYTIRKKDYIIDFEIESQGFQSLVQYNNPVLFEWKLKGFRHAKSVKYENRYTTLTYKYEEDKTSSLSPTGEDSEEEVGIDWVSYQQHFFSSILIAENPFKTATFNSFNLVEAEGEDVKHTKEFTSHISLNHNQGELKTSLHWYFGPTDYKVLNSYNQYDLSESVPLGWGIFGWMNRYIFIPAFDFLTSILPHGIAIIVMTIIVRLLMSPITYKSYISQARMKVLRPEITEINEKHPGKENAMKRQQATMALYQKAGVNPMSGCIPALLQIPIFYALFTFFPTAFVLRQKSFLWAEDLSSYDVVAHLPFTIPFYGNHISLFPLLASIAIFIYMTMTTGQTMQQNQQPGMPNMKFMIYLSPVMMLFFFNNYASGLSLYYFISNLITILIMLVIKKYIINENKIHAKIQQNRTKPKKVNRFQRRMQDLMEQAEQNKKGNNKRK